MQYVSGCTGTLSNFTEEELKLVDPHALRLELSRLQAKSEQKVIDDTDFVLGPLIFLTFTRNVLLENLIDSLPEYERQKDSKKNLDSIQQESKREAYAASSKGSTKAPTRSSKKNSKTTGWEPIPRRSVGDYPATNSESAAIDLDSTAILVESKSSSSSQEKKKIQKSNDTTTSSEIITTSQNVSSLLHSSSSTSQLQQQQSHPDGELSQSSMPSLHHLPYDVNSLSFTVPGESTVISCARFVRIELIKLTQTFMGMIEKGTLTPTIRTLYKRKYFEMSDSTLEFLLCSVIAKYRDQYKAYKKALIFRHLYVFQHTLPHLLRW